MVGGSKASDLGGFMVVAKSVRVRLVERLGFRVKLRVSFKGIASHNKDRRPQALKPLYAVAPEPSFPPNPKRCIR